MKGSVKRVVRYHQAIMGQVLIRQLDDKVIALLKRRAKGNGRSLEAELRQLLTDFTADPWDELRAIRESLSGRPLADGSELMRDPVKEPARR